MVQLTLDFNPTPTKRCPHCERDLPLEKFSKRGDSKTRLKSWCKECINADYKQKSDANREQVKKRSRKHYLANKERINQRGREYYQKNKERMNQVNRRWREANPERNKELIRRWHRENRERIRIVQTNAYAKFGKVQGVCTVKQWLAKLEYQAWLCFYCKAPLTSKTLHLDHRKPLSRGGLNWPSNLVAACPTCNLRKNDKTESEFRATLRNP